jgi:sugar phosphate permease
MISASGSANTAMSNAAGAERPTRIRHLVIALLSLAAFSAYLTRVCISTAATTIQSDLGLSNERMGAVFAAFSFGYFLFQAPGGWLGGRFGARLVLPAMSVAWSLGTCFSGLAHSLWSLWSARLAFGLAQGGMVPCASKVLADWVPAHFRGTASALLGSSMSVGAVLASGLTAMLLPTVGWRSLFLMYSLVGVGWALAFFSLFRDRPADHPWVNAAERLLIEADRPLTVPADGPPRLSRRGMVRSALRGPGLWAICAQSFFRAFGYAFFVTWFPAYLQKAHGVRVVQAGLLAMLPLAGVVAGSLAGGVVVDRLLQRTGNKRISRSATGAVALLLCGIATLGAGAARHTLAAVLVIAFGSFFMGVSGPCAWAATMDISGKYTAIIFAVMNMAGVLGDIASPLSVGYLFTYLERSPGQWNVILVLFTAIYVAGAVSFAVLDPNRPVWGDTC